MWSGASTEMSEAPFKAVCDAGPIIHLEEIGALYLIEDFHEILLSPAVKDEVQKKLPNLFVSVGPPFVVLPHALPADQTLIAMCRAFSLGTGESEALALMEKDPTAVFLTDDSAARLVAERMGYKVHGTVGILLRSVRRNQLKPKEVLSLLNNIPQKCSLFIKPSLLDEIKLRVKDEFHL
jgi:predicted nucleic acid-binding protein